MKKITILAAVVALLGSCAQNTEDTIKPNAKVEGRTIYATFDNEEEETKTYVENYKYLRWHAGDEISFFDATTHNSQYAFAGNNGDAEGEFNAVATGEGTAIATTYGVYPYNANTSISEEGIISVELPAIQAYGVNSFGRGANTMVAVGESATDDKLFFKNACGYLVVKLYNENGAAVKSVVLEGNNEEKISGAATITATHAGVPSVAMADTATTSVTIDCGEGIEIGTTAETATEFWFALPEITFEGGITITATDTEGKEYEKTTTKPVVITRNNVQPMKALGCEFAIPDTWKIYYTASSKVEPYNKTVFGANYVSNEWDETTGEGVINFDGNVTKIGDYAFKNCTALKTIVINNTITEIGEGAFCGCSGLTSTTIGASVNKIGLLAFENCKGTLYLNCDVDYYNVNSSQSINGVFYKSKFERVIIGEGVTAIGQDAFYNCPITSLSLPSTLKIIRDRAFASTDITTVTIPENVTLIETECFYGCDKLKIVYLNPITPPATGSFVNGYESNWRAFGLCDASIFVPNEAYNKYIESQGWRYHAYFYLREGETLDDHSRISNRMIWYTNTSNNMLSAMWGSGVWGDATLQFHHYDSNAKIGFLIFDKELSAITDDSALYLPSSSSTVKTTFTLPSSLKEIVPRIFYQLNVQKFYGPLATDDNKAIILGSTLHSYTQHDTSTVYTIPDGVTHIEERAFEGAQYLNTITIPDSVVSIGDWCLGSGVNLYRINIGSGIKEIGEAAFANNRNLQYVYCKALTPPTLGEIALPSTASFRIYVPYDAATAYQNAEGWSQYKWDIIGTSNFGY